MNVLYCLPESYNGERWGGITTYTITTASELVRQGHHVDIVCPGDHRKTVHYHGIHIYYETSPRYSFIAFRFFRRICPELTERIRWILSVYIYWKRHGPYDIVEYPEWRASGLLVALFTRQTCVCRLHRSTLQCIFDNKATVTAEDVCINILEMISAMVSNASSSPTRYMYHSHPALTYVQRLLHKKQFVIPCGIHIPRQLQISDVHIRTPYILFVGRIEKGKGCEVLLRAFHEVRALNPNVRLIFIGEDTNLLFGARTYTSYIQYLRTNVLTKDMEKFVTFLNRKTQANLSKYYQQCLYAVIPSFGNENMPFTALDAMKYGKPLIVSNTGGLPEFVKHARNGLVVSPEDEKALAAAMIQLIHDADMRQRFSINNFRDRNKFESKKIASATIKFYQSI